MEDKFKLKLYSCIYLHSTYQTQTMGMRIHDILFFVSVLGKSLKNLVGKRVTGPRKGNQQFRNSFQV